MLFPCLDISSGSHLPTVWSLAQGSAAFYVQKQLVSILGLIQNLFTSVVALDSECA